MNPTSIGCYKIQDQIGSGRTGVVKLATREGSDCIFAIKILKKSQFYTLALAKQFRKEVDILMRTNSPRLLKLLDFLEDSESYYLITEYCAAGDLAHFVISRRYLEETEARSIFKQIVEGLSFLQKMGIAHRDVKPENIIIDSNGQAKIADFGFATEIADPNPDFSTRCGTTGYASPELINGMETFDPFKSDAWSCGVLLFMMVTGRLPWTLSNHRELVHQITSADFMVPMIVSAPCTSLIKRIVKVNPDERLTFDQILEDPWIKGVRVPTVSSDASTQVFYNREKVEATLQKLISSLDHSRKRKRETEPAKGVTRLIQSKKIVTPVTKSVVPAAKKSSVRAIHACSLRNTSHIFK